MTLNLKNHRATVIVTSDTCYKDNNLDISGEHVLKDLKDFGFVNTFKYIVPDDEEKLSEVLLNTINDKLNVLILTVGGTGLCPRDITPEVTRKFYDKECSSIATSIVTSSLRITPYAALSRITSGISKSSLIINFPGSCKACKECFESIKPFLKHALDQVAFDRQSIDKTHDEIVGVTKTGNSSYTCVCSNISQFRRITSPYELVSYEKALNLLENIDINLSELEINLSDISLQSLVGKVICKELTSKHKVPNFDCSIVDGYILARCNKSVNYGEENITALLVPSLDQLMNLEELKHECSYICCQVNTGQQVPPKQFDFVVVPVEYVSYKNNNVSFKSIPKGRYIRKEGSDIEIGDSIMPGTVISPTTIGVMLQMRLDKIFVKSLTVGVMSTGNELIVSKSIETSVVDVNRPMLICILEKSGFTTNDCGVGLDNYEELLRHLKFELNNNDVLILTGGASMGSCDYVKEVIEELGGTLIFGRVQMKPGKPACCFIINHNEKKKVIFSLPGNPVSAYITCLVLVMPYLFHLMKKDYVQSKLSIENSFLTMQVIIHIIEENDTEYKFEPRLEFLRAKMLHRQENNVYAVQVSIKQQSSRLKSFDGCDCLVIIPKDCDNLTLALGQSYMGINLGFSPRFMG